MDEGTDWAATPPGENSGPISQGRGSAEPVTVLKNLRIIFAVLVMGVAMFVVLVVGLGIDGSSGATTSSGAASKPPTGLPVPVTLVVFALLVAGQVVLARRERPLDCSTPAKLIDTYRTRMLIRCVISEVAALFAIVTYMIGTGWWALITGLIIGGYGMWHAAPLTAAIERDQERLQSQGCANSLIDALNQTAPQARRR